jgi:hypothetical protein
MHLGRRTAASGGTLNNCIVYHNTAPEGPNYYEHGYSHEGIAIVMNSCCTTPMPILGGGNITNAPLFVDSAGGNLRLQSNSPCINAGNNAYTQEGSTDLEGNPWTSEPTSSFRLVSASAGMW